MDACQRMLDARLRTVRRNRALRALAAFAAAAAAATLVALTLIVGVARVEGDSMYPALHDGDLVIYQRLGKSLVAGSVVAFHDEDGVGYVKRVEGLPGDVVEIETRATGGAGALPCSYEVPEGCVYVLGDNRAVSFDSRVMGAIPEARVDGVVLVTVRV